MLLELPHIRPLIKSDVRHCNITAVASSPAACCCLLASKLVWHQKIVPLLGTPADCFARATSRKSLMSHLEPSPV